MEFGNITLELSGLSVTLTLFPNAECPRIRADIGKVTYSASGVAVGSGMNYEPKHLWDVNVLCDPEQMRLLKLIYIEHDTLRRSLQPCDVLVTDITELYEDRYPRSRAIAPDTEQVDYPETNPTHCLYYAQFKAWFNEAPKLAKKGGYWAAQFTLAETDRVLP